MKVLYISGTCLTNNTSANMSHNAFVQGLLENGCDVDIIMARDSWGEPDSALPVWEDARYYVFSSLSPADIIRRKLRGTPQKSNVSTSQQESGPYSGIPKKASIKKKLHDAGKSLFYSIFRPDKIYPLEKEWLKKASRFRSKRIYDLVISNSSPAASHRLVIELKKRGNLRFKRWVQIWEDPWYHDLYGGHSSEIQKEERFLLRKASEVAYVSPLTLMYQKKYYPDCAEKMTCVPLPALELPGDHSETADEVSFGYFGDYYSVTRNLKPFYEAAVGTGYRGYIYGDSDICLKGTDRIEVSGRVTLDKLQKIQDKTSVLVHLCNLRGGQIPGKIYHYSVTTKPILFILDGTEEEKRELLDYFESYNRYYFCDNIVESICMAMERIAEEGRSFLPVKEFTPKAVVRKILG